MCCPISVITSHTRHPPRTPARFSSPQAGKKRRPLDAGFFSPIDKLRSHAPKTSEVLKTSEVFARSLLRARLFTFLDCPEMPRRTDLKKILLIGSGPIVIGQACEFDYSGTQACKALREEGYTVVLVNSNPATIMTDPETADRTYIEPITWEIVAKILEKERPDALLPTLGGQTGLNTAMDLARHGVLERLGVEMIGANAEVIDKAENREKFKN